MTALPTARLRALAELGQVPNDQLAALAELEQLAIYGQFSRGLTPEWATRPMTPSEVASRVSFAALDGILTAGYAETAASLEQLRSTLLLQLLKTVTVAAPGDAAERVGNNERAAIMAAVAAWAADKSPAVQAAIDAAYAELALALLRAGRLAEDELIREARKQGQRPRRKRAPRPPPPDQDKTAREAVDVVHQLAAAAAVKHTEQPPSTAGQTRHEVVDELAQAVGEASLAPAADLARQAVNIAFGAGRSAAAHALPPAEWVVASELLDAAGCETCAAVDGTHYPSVAAAEDDYPHSGGYRHCKGGYRCRGTLVLLYPESPPGGSP